MSAVLDLDESSDWVRVARQLRHRGSCFGVWASGIDKLPSHFLLRLGRAFDVIGAVPVCLIVAGDEQGVHPSGSEQVVETRVAESAKEMASRLAASRTAFNTVLVDMRSFGAGRYVDLFGAIDAVVLVIVAGTSSESALRADKERFGQLPIAGVVIAES